MVSDFVLTQHDVVTTTFKNKTDVVGLGSYTVDVPGPAQRVVVNGQVANEGLVIIMEYYYTTTNNNNDNNR